MNAGDGVSSSEPVTGESVDTHSLAHPSDCKRIFLWKKPAVPGDNEVLAVPVILDDDPGAYPNFRRVIQQLGPHKEDKEMPFTDLKGKYPNIIRLIKRIMGSYPEPDNEAVDGLIEYYRESLRTRSKEADKHIVVVILLDDTFLIAHCKKDFAIAEWQQKVQAVDQLLSPDNVIRAGIIRHEKEATIFYPYEKYSTMRKGHADFWGIMADSINWGLPGEFALNVDVEDFGYPIQVPADSDRLKEMVQEGTVAQDGTIKIASAIGMIVNVQYGRRRINFQDVYDILIKEGAKLKENAEKFRELLAQPEGPGLNVFGMPITYWEDEERVCMRESFRYKPFFEKSISRFTMCFFTKTPPTITPNKKLLKKLHDGVFSRGTKKVDICHAGLPSAEMPFTIGSLNIYNDIGMGAEASHEADTFHRELLNKIEDAKGKKESLLLEIALCEYWKKNLKCEHLTDLFDLIVDNKLRPALKREFGHGGMLSKEGCVEFKSARKIENEAGYDEDDHINREKFVNAILVKTVKKYAKKGVITRHCIIYGIEDDGKIRCVYNLKNDDAKTIEDEGNKALSDENIRISVYPIPFNDEFLLAVFIEPIIK
jgi:hypothetical protein